MIKNKKLILFLLLLAAILILNHHYGWSQMITDEGSLSFLQDQVEENLLSAMFLYVLLTVIGCVVLALPGATFAFFAGILFGPWIGILLCLIATTLGAAMAFLMGRYFLKDSIRPVVLKNPYLAKLLFSGNRKSEMVVLMITRLVPLFPYNLQNFAYGITDISFFHYTIYTFLFMLPGVAFFTIGSAGITAAQGKIWYFLTALVLFLLVTLTGILIRKHFLGNDKEEAE